MEVNSSGMPIQMVKVDSSRKYVVYLVFDVKCGTGYLGNLLKL
jgi:hypothetical protein